MRGTKRSCQRFLPRKRTCRSCSFCTPRSTGCFYSHPTALERIQDGCQQSHTYVPISTRHPVLMSSSMTTYSHYGTSSALTPPSSTSCSQNATPTSSALSWTHGASTAGCQTDAPQTTTGECRAAQTPTTSSPTPG